MASKAWPSWWLWELEFVPHLLKRMADRDFDEIDLRTMLENASGFSPNVVPGRFTVQTRHSGQPWEVSSNRTMMTSSSWSSQHTQRADT